jgi:D-alanyl-D-alanine carboxypeptidase/D-alanyl-D-alanine-endopeptidase (penicillin-binding protein 4)
LVVGGLLVPAAAAPPAAAPGLATLVDEVVEGPAYKHASWGILVANAKTGETVYARNPDALLAPASVTKLFTAAAALVTLGADHTFETAVYQRGLLLNGGTLHGDLILVASGDLTLGGRTSKDGRTVYRDKDHTYANSGLMESELTDTDPLAGLEALARQVKESGVKQIDGEVLVDDHLFARARGTGSGPDSVCAITVNDNLIDVIVEPGTNIGDSAKVTTRPATSFAQIDEVVSTGPEGSPVELHLVGLGPHQFAIRGRVPKGGKPIVRIYGVEDPALFARALFIEALRRNGVRATAAILRPDASAALPARSAYDKLPKVASFISPPFKDVLNVTLKVSHNLYASTFPCLVAVAKDKTTVEAGLREGREVFKKLGVDVGAISFGGGAGGAPADYVSARATVDLLRGMAKRPDWDVYQAALPVLGVDGTLAEVVKPESPARGQVRAKTGTLIWFDATNDRFLLKSKALAGVMTTRAGTQLTFAMMVNNVPLPKGVPASREGKVLGRLCEILYENGP